MDYNKNITVQLERTYSTILNKLWHNLLSTDLVILSQLIRSVHDTGISITTVRTNISGELDFFYFR